MTLAGRNDSLQGYLTCVGLFLLLFARLLFGSLSNAMTADEPSHLASGYAWLARGQAAFWTLSERGHPLLVDAWLALPLYIAQPDVPLEDLPGWQGSYGTFIHSFRRYLDPTRRALLAGRVPEMLLTVLLAAVVYRWGRDLWSSRAGWLALAALVLDPTLVAHGRLATNGVGLVAMGTLALYVAWRWWRRTDWRHAIGLGVLLAATMLSKQSGILWAGAIALGTLYLGVAERRPWRFWAQAMAVGAVSLLLIWATYGFSFGPVPALSISLPAPLHWQGILRHRDDTGHKLVYALGMRRAGSWWWYFILAFAIKNSLPFLLAVGAGAAVLVRRRVVPDRVCALGIFFVLYTAVALVVGMNIGYRHMLPIHPILYLIVAGGLCRWAWAEQRHGWRKWTLGALGIWYIVGTAWIYPYELAYFGELAGGPAQGYRYLSDSNVDWGQSGYVVQDYVRTHPDVNTEPPDARLHPSPGRYVVGASYWQGLGLGDPGVYEWFRHREPDAVLNYSHLIFDVQPLNVRWFAQCDTPRLPLERDAVVQGMGRDDLRLLRFDCTQAWIYPGGGGAGIYALPRPRIGDPGVCFPSMLPCPNAPEDPFVATHIAHGRLSFEQAQDAQLSPSLLYEWLPGGIAFPFSSAAYAPRGGAPPSELRAADPLDAPVTMNGTLSFLGAVAYPDQDVLNVETWWQVEGGPSPRPFSIMGQLVAASGETVGMYDKLGLSPLELHTGDVLVQRHLFAAPPEGVVVWLRTGVYWLDTMERWTVDGKPALDMFLVPLEVGE